MLLQAKNRALQQRLNSIWSVSWTRYFHFFWTSENIYTTKYAKRKEEWAHQKSYLLHPCLLGRNKTTHLKRPQDYTNIARNVLIIFWFLEKIDQALHIKGKKHQRKQGEKGRKQAKPSRLEETMSAHNVLSAPHAGLLATFRAQHKYHFFRGASLTALCKLASQLSSITSPNLFPLQHL